jgi:hypothetical protein
MAESLQVRLIPVANCSSDSDGLRRALYVVYDAQGNPLGIDPENGSGPVDSWEMGCVFQTDRSDPDVVFRYATNSQLRGPVFLGVELLCFGETPCGRRLAKLPLDADQA